MACNTPKKSKEEKVKEILAMKNTTPKSFHNPQAVEYMQKPSVIEFSRTLTDRAFSSKHGRPMAFSSVEQLESDFKEFMELCYKTSTTPTIVAMALWLDCNRDTIYAHASDSNSPFSETCKKMIEVCHQSLENRAVDGKTNAVLYMFLGKNYFGMKDDKNITVTPASQSDIPADTMGAIQKQLEQENIPNADYTEKK